MKTLRVGTGQISEGGVSLPQHCCLLFCVVCFTPMRFPARFFTRSACTVFSACLVVFCQAPVTRIRDPNSILVFFHFPSYLTCPSSVLSSVLSMLLATPSTWTTASFPDSAPVRTLFTFWEKAVESWL